LVNSEKLWIDFIPIALHVDYWNYLGCKDSYASQQTKQRQYKHQQLHNLKSVYTPSFVINGKDCRGFFKGDAMAHAAKKLTGQL
jgi:hypothetical protein